MLTYYVTCNDRKGVGPGYQYTERDKAIECANNAWKSGYFETVLVQFPSVFRPGMYVTIWKNGELR